VRSRERLEDGLRKHLARLLLRFDACFDALPFDLNAGSFNDSDRGVGDFRTDAVAGD
jgi:hypothetical protein